MRRVEAKPVLAACALLAGLALGGADRAWAVTFSVNPTRVILTGRVTNALITLRNESDQGARFQLSAFAWDQAPDGQMKLAPTEDIIFYPQMLALGPREERKVRVGTTLAPGAIERSYRLFVEELPPAAGEENAGKVRVFTKVGIPVFLRASESAPRAELRNLRYGEGRVSFTLANAGSTFFVPDSIVVRALGADGQPIGSQDVKGWYVLAGGVRVFDIEGPKPPASPTAFVVEVRVGTLTLAERLDVLPQPPRR